MLRHSILATVLACLATPAFGLEDIIVVTASRLSEPKDSGPVAVGVLAAQELDRIGAHHIAETLNRLPGVYINRGNGVEHLTSIRSAVLTGGAGAGSFLYLQDGISLRAPGFSNINGLMEANDALAGGIEVIRGPGGASYGTNALHGLINILSPDPSLGRMEALVEIGSFGRSRVESSVSGETDFGAGYVGLALRQEDGWRDDASLFRAGLLARLDGGVGQSEWSLRASFIDIDQETATFVRGFEAYRNESLSRTNADPEAFRNVRALRVSAHVTSPVTDQARLEFVGYGRSNEMDFRLHFLPSEALERTGHDSLGFQSALVWESSQSRVSVGLDGDFTDGFLFEFQDRPTIGPFVQGLHYDYQVQASVLAGFVQARHVFADAVTVDAGVRLEGTRFDYDNAASDGAVGRYLRPSDRTDTFETVTPNIGAVWQVTEKMQLFSRAARGVRAPQTSELYRLQPGQVIEGIDPETLDSVEFGLRWTQERFQLEAVSYAMEKQNVFFRDADGFNVTDGESRHHGIEVDLAVDISQTLSAGISASWAIHEYAFNRNVSRSSDFIVDGARIDTAPEWLWNARLIWAPVDEVEVEAEWIHVGEYFADAGNTARYDGHDLLNLRARYQLGSDWSVFSNIRNLADERFAERADFAFGSYRYFPGEPRSVSIGLAYTR